MTTNPLSPTSNMADFRTRTSGADNTLFGETLTRQTIVNLAIGGLTSLFVLVTVISSFVFPTPPPTALNIFFVVCIIMICSSVLVLSWEFYNLVFYCATCSQCCNMMFDSLG
ncbi:transmembrane protein 243 isoform X2 [Labeo rohita]|uniref:transmembrane protein 243 isoform X2 n=1 Tax=Labeo rohita TaxID=84645 RepID=UPI0021E2A2FC|nr:transmembrane protein 243 isoform X2 [Labeo rohita]